MTKETKRAFLETADLVPEFASANAPDKFHDLLAVAYSRGLHARAATEPPQEDRTETKGSMVWGPTYPLPTPMEQPLVSIAQSLTSIARSIQINAMRRQEEILLTSTEEQLERRREAYYSASILDSASRASDLYHSLPLETKQ